MEQQWTKKRILRLSQADAAVIEQWLDEYIHVIYTWQYYQVGADAEIAADLTWRTFKRAVESLATFNPETETMLEWLRMQGRQARDEGLEIRQIRAQRPWAWTQLPDNVLCGLSHLRDEPLSEDITNNPFIREIIQAALAEMEGPNRELMMHRYNHLDTAEHIASETGQSIADVNDRLYRCRHTFRRVFMQLVQSVNSGFSESSAAGTLELLDANLEKLLSSTDMVQSISPKEQAKTREIVLAAARETPPLQSSNTQQTAIIAGSAVLLILLLVIAGVILWLNMRTIEPAETPEHAAATQEQSQTPAPTTSQNIPAPMEDEIDQAELERVFMMGQAGDLSGLLNVLKNGQYTSQIAAAHFVGRIGGESAMGVLEEAEMQRYPNGPEDNPFSEAIGQIEDRLLADAEVLIKEPNETETVAADEETPTRPEAVQEQLPTKPKTAIQGIVRNSAGEPLYNAELTISANPLYGAMSDVRVLAQAVSNDVGLYEFSAQPAGAYYLDCRNGVGNIAVSRSLWYNADGICTIDFGGTPVMSGLLVDASSGAAEQLMYLSDTPNPTNASFRAECLTDSAGAFSFVGIQAGSYYLLNATDPSGIVQLDTIDIAQEDIVNRQIIMQYASISVTVENPENAPGVFSVFLAYGPDVSSEMVRYPCVAQGDGIYTSDMIPFGSYTLITMFENGMRLQQPLELNGDRELVVTAPAGDCMLSGSFRNPTPHRFFLYNTDQRVRFDLGADGDGPYVLDAVPADIYTLAAFVNGLLFDFMDIDLRSEPEQMLDIDTDELLADLSPLYVAVTDAQGAMISGAQVWVTGTSEVLKTQSTGRGAFLALEPGEYSLFGALPGYSTAEEVIQVQSMPLETPANSNNTIWLRLQAP